MPERNSPMPGACDSARPVRGEQAARGAAGQSHQYGFANTELQNRLPRESERLKHRYFARPFADRHGHGVARNGRAHRGLPGDERRRAARTGTARGWSPRGRSGAEDGGGPAILPCDGKRPLEGAPEIVGPAAIAIRAACRIGRPPRKAGARPPSTRRAAQRSEATEGHTPRRGSCSPYGLSRRV